MRCGVVWCVHRCAEKGGGVVWGGGEPGDRGRGKMLLTVC